MLGYVKGGFENWMYEKLLLNLSQWEEGSKIQRIVRIAKKRR
jgi:hypothetical protein